MRPHSFWVPRVLTCSARDGTAIDEVWQMIDTYFDAAVANGYQEELRTAQRAGWMNALFVRELQTLALSKPGVRETLEHMRRQVLEGAATPYAAIQRIVQLL
jgi:LAO/AO transport system kinase